MKKATPRPTKRGKTSVASSSRPPVPSPKGPFVNLINIVKVMLYVTSLFYMGNKGVLKVELTF